MMSRTCFPIFTIFF